ncbi:hypothetical protein SAMN04487965_0598 [Microbulbifer donghaiensis]|uniref:Uncharacterized protein n=1 Tax=Microbulbifer donghaiensis TaxID=494016 RepID=A0A1M4W5G0_9GAMM|nr:hypothetical protein [Microbulbifer donghaiensis]SHE76202.1 hypothetical protein SAMN04487965_0598 [Microbulbifer donghaiensis]
MKDYTGLCYTFAEAQDIMSLRPSELQHEIRTKKLKPVIYTEPRQILLFLPRESGEWVGLATCTYRGHMTVAFSTVANLLDGSSSNVGNGWGRLLDESGISHWNSAYPFQRPVPHGHLKEWRPLARDEIPLHRLCATPLPKEFTPLHDTVNDFIRQIATVYKGEEATDKALKELPEKNGLMLDFKTNSEIHPNSLRIPASEIDQYQQSLKEDKVVVSTTTNGKKENQFHTLLTRVIKHSPEIKAKHAWTLLEKDFESDEAAFDLDGIIQAISPTELEWKSRHGNTSYLKFNSFAPTLSKVRGKLKEDEKNN